MNQPRLRTIFRVMWIALMAVGGTHAGLFLAFLHNQGHVLALSNFEIWFSTVLTTLSLLAFYSVSAFLMWRRAHDRITVLVSLFLIALGSQMASNYLPVTREAAMAVYPMIRTTAPLLDSIGWGGFALFVGLFPDGHFPAPWVRIVIVYPLLFTVVTPLVPTGSVLDTDTWTPFANLLLIVTISLSGILIVAYRYQKVSNALQRQQTKWVGIALITILILLIIYHTRDATFSRLDLPVIVIDILRSLTGFSLILIPITILIAILQYRLWDIDLIIRRTLTYATITILLGLVYFGGVIVLQALFNQVTGSDSPLAVVASTLLIAALFNPLRTRVQAFVDRRFYRQKYDMQQTLEEFGDIARDEVVLEEIEQALVSTVHDTMQPEHISLWLTPSDSASKQM